jgi:hypothetical protein
VKIYYLKRLVLKIIVYIHLCSIFQEKGFRTSGIDFGPGFVLFVGKLLER